MSKKLNTLIRCLSLFYATFSCFIVQAGFTSNTKKLTLALVQEWGPFNPITNTLASNQALNDFLIRQITLKSSNGKIIPDLVENIPMLKNKVATWNIKKNARWGDGHDVTCEDWQLGWKIGLNSNVSVESRSLYSKIKNISWDKSKPQTCNVEYATDDWSYDRDLPYPVPAHIEKTIYEQNQKTAQAYERNSNYVNYPNLSGLYNGPYILSEFKLGSHLIFKRNKYFYSEPALFEQIIIKFIPDTSSLRAYLKSKEIDGVSAVGFPPDLALELDEEFKQPNSFYQVKFQNSNIFQGLFFNLNNDLLKEKNVRKAISLTIDKETLVKSFYQNKLSAAQSILPPQHPNYRWTASLYSKKKARSLLIEAGWRPNSNQILEKDGKKLSFVFKTSSGIKVLESVQLYICQQFKDIGIECVIKNEPPRVLLGSSVPHGEFDLVIFGQPIPADTSLASYFSSTEIPTNTNSWAGGNSIRLRSIEIDELLKNFEKESNRLKRNELVFKISEFIQNESFLVPLYHRREAVVLPKWITGVVDAFDGTSFQQPELWKIKDSPKKVNSLKKLDLPKTPDTLKSSEDSSHSNNTEPESSENNQN